MKNICIEEEVIIHLTFNPGVGVGVGVTTHWLNLYTKVIHEK